MPRTVNNVAAHKRKKKILKLARGYRGGRSKLYKTARQAVEKGWLYAYRDRKAKKREFRRLWIIRINAGARLHNLSYSQLIHGLKLAEVEIDRKALAYLAFKDEKAFGELCEVAKSRLN
jgi:large subunit ribosomal protein L20